MYTKYRSVSIDGNYHRNEIDRYMLLPFGRIRDSIAKMPSCSADGMTTANDKRDI